MAYKKKGDLFQAMEHVLRYVEAVEDEAEKEDAEEVYDILAAKLQKTFGELRLTSEPSGAVVVLQGERLVMALWRLQ